MPGARFHTPDTSGFPHGSLSLRLRAKADSVLLPSIQRRALVCHGGRGLRHKSWSAATPHDLPTHFSVDNLYVMHTFSSCARTRFKRCLNAAMGDVGTGQVGSCRHARAHESVGIASIVEHHTAHGVIRYTAGKKIVAYREFRQ